MSCSLMRGNGVCAEEAQLYQQIRLLRCARTKRFRTAGNLAAQRRFSRVSTWQPCGKWVITHDGETALGCQPPASSMCGVSTPFQVRPTRTTRLIGLSAGSCGRARRSTAPWRLRTQRRKAPGGFGRPTAWPSLVHRSLAGLSKQATFYPCRISVEVPHRSFPFPSRCSPVPLVTPSTSGLENTSLSPSIASSARHRTSSPA